MKNLQQFVAQVFTHPATPVPIPPRKNRKKISIKKEEDDVVILSTTQRHVPSPLPVSLPQLLPSPILPQFLTGPQLPQLPNGPPLSTSSSLDLVMEFLVRQERDHQEAKRLQQERISWERQQLLNRLSTVLLVSKIHVRSI
jgi:hypothetical protein